MQPKQQLFALGVISLGPYFAAWRLGNLRQHTVAFEAAFCAAFLLYAAASIAALHVKHLTQRELAACFVLAALMQGILISTTPTLSDDMYRYVWEGRVQAHGYSPYLYAPDAPQLAPLRDEAIWRSVNRKSDITVYPPAAEMAYALLWHIWPDNVHWFQLIMSLSGLAGGLLLVGLLRALDLSASRVIIYLWAPLLAFETAHSAHVDGLILPLLIGAWWARTNEHDGWTGFLLGLAAAIKIYPVLLLPALWRPRHPQGRWRLPLAFLLTVAGCYMPYVLWNGTAVIGFLPKYFNERFNVGLVAWLIPLFRHGGVDPSRGVLALTLAALLLASGWMIVHPAPNGQTAIRRCIWLIGVVTLLSQNLFSWYMLWVLPLVAIFLQPGRSFRLRVDGWTAWWLFCGLVMLSYTFFIRWRPVPVVPWVEFLPMYLLLLPDVGRHIAATVRQWTPARSNT